MKKLSLKQLAIKASHSAQDLLPGGLADFINPDTLNQKEIDRGMKVELEHTNNEDLAREIARDHLSEDPSYYEKLEKMERKSNKMFSLLSLGKLKQLAIRANRLDNAGQHKKANVLDRQLKRLAADGEAVFLMESQDLQAVVDFLYKPKCTIEVTEDREASTNSSKSFYFNQDPSITFTLIDADESGDTGSLSSIRDTLNALSDMQRGVGGKIKQQMSDLRNTRYDDLPETDDTWEPQPPSLDKMKFKFPRSEEAQ